MTSIIDQLIDKRDGEIRLAQEAKEAERKEALEKRFSELKAYLGEFWTLLEKRAEETGVKYPMSTDWGGHYSPTIHLDILALDDHKLAPIDIKWSGASPSSGYYDYNEVFKVSGKSYHNLEDALRAAREYYPEYLEKKRKERIDWFNKETRYNQSPRKTEEEIRALVEEIKTEFPDKAEQADNILSEWIRLRDLETKEADDRRRAEETRKAEEALKNTLRIKYILELSEWLKARDAIEVVNTEKAERIQETADLAFYRVYKLTYALIAKYEEDGEEETQVETREVYTFQSKADHSGYWMVDGTLTKFYNPVTLEVLDVHASSGILSKKAKKAGYTFFFTPSTSDESIADILSIIEEYPDEPEHPGELGYLDDYTKRTYYLPRARALLNGEGETDPEIEAPF